ncbi:MAG: hypothetical protein RJQ09_01145 [Cyclobacteriaceae bacterium]
MGCQGNFIPEDPQDTSAGPPKPDTYADVVDVYVLGNEKNYEFHVTIQSPDSSCRQYADYWELVSRDGELLYRRLMAHSHVDEQPFTRSGHGVPILSDQVVWIRAHMNNVGYGGKTMKGAVVDGFQHIQIPDRFAHDLENEGVKPPDCAF